MARKGYGRQDSLLNTSTYQDDDSYPIGSNEWNKNPKTDGIFGFTKAVSGISSNGVTITDSYVEVTDAGTIHKILPSTTALPSANYGSGTDGASTSIKSFGEGDLIYVVKANGVGTVTLNHQQSGVTDGKINTLSEVPITLDENIPKIFMCRNKDQAGNLEWFEYGGGAQTTPTDITVEDTTDTTCFPSLFESATGDLEPKTDAGLTYNAGNATLTATTFAGALTGNASTATALATARTIGGTSFDGTANIAVALSATSTALATARTIGGVSFDGTANINLAGVNTAGNQDTSGTAAIATAVTITDNENSNESNAIVFTSGGTATGNLGLESDGDLTYNPSSGLVTVPALTVTGNLTVSGTTTTLDVTNLAVEDPLIQLAKANAGADTIDIGFWGLYDTSGSQDLRSGLFRDANDSGKWKLFKDTQEDLTSVTAINTGATGYATATLVANIEGNVTGDVTGNASGTALTVTQAAQTAITSVGTLTGLGLSGALTSTSTAQFSQVDIISEGDLRLQDNTGGQYVGFEAPATVSSSYTLEMPAATGSSGEVLKMSSSANVLEWGSAGGGATATHDFTLNAYDYSGGAPSGTTRYIYTKVHKNADGTEDTNNEDVFIRCKKNGTADTEVQIA